MKVVISTSDKYHHVLRIGLFLFSKYWNVPAEVVGYKKPDFELPANISFHSMGEQVGGPDNFSGDLRKYFEKQDRVFAYMMEDTFLKDYVKTSAINSIAVALEKNNHIGRFSLSPDSIKHYTTIFHKTEKITIYKTPADSDYRLSLMPAMWNKDYLLKYLTPGMTPWQFENQNGTLMQKPDYDFLNLAFDKDWCAISHNEGVRKRDLYAYDLNGIDESVINEMKVKKIL